GVVMGLAIANGVLLASSDDGSIHAFRSAKAPKPAFSPPPKLKRPARDQLKKTASSDRVEEILSELNRERGYALVVGDDSGDLVYELGRQSELQVVGIGMSPAAVARQRKRLSESGLHGQAALHDVSVQAPPYAEDIFNLIVLSSAKTNASPWRKLLRPGGGLLVQGSQSSLREKAPDGGSWSHLYANPGNTSSSGDLMSRGGFKLQWFGRPGPQHIIDRHLRAMSPVARNGFLFVPGDNYLFGVDAFNGAILWEREIPDFRRIAVLRDCGSLAVGEKLLYAASGKQCLMLDPLTGKETGALAVPSAEEQREWGYLAVLGDVLIGSAVAQGGVYREMSNQAIYAAAYADGKKITVSRELFAYRAREDGKQPLWRYLPKGAVFNPTITMNQRHVVFLESRNPSTQTGPGRNGYAELLYRAGADVVALDRATGKVAWRQEFKAPSEIQTLFLSCTDREIACVYSHNAATESATKKTIHYETQILGADGSPRWRARHNTGIGVNKDHGEQDQHPAIVGDRIVVRNRVYDLVSGKVLRTVARGRGCGTISASGDAIFCRSGNPSSFDLETGKWTKVNEVSRPGCWINMIPSDGLLLVPEGSSGCICKFPLQCSMAFRPHQP
ncbi:MAG: PQQ-binding-like beta-propeller repeat protein, partial [Planctomycetales bacterium]